MAGSHSSLDEKHDPEKAGGIYEPEQHDTHVTELEALDDGIPRNKGAFAALWTFTQKLDRFGVEARGIERIPEDMRTGHSVWNCFTVWFAANMTVSTFSLGTLGASIFYLGFRDACLTIIFFNLLSTAPVAYFSIFGARTGFRQIVFSRYAFGYWVAMFPALLNVIATIGWSTVNTIVGAQVLNAVSTSHQLPLAAGCVIIALLTLLPAFAGYKVVHTYERYAAIIPFVVFCFIAGETGKYVEVGPYGGSGKAEAGSVLSFAAAIVGFGIGWVSYAADYTVNLQHDTPGWKIFFTTYIGLNIPLILIEILGAAVMTTLTQKTTWADRAYPGGSTELEIGGLIAATLSPMNGFGGFLCVLAALSIIANNIPNLYSLSLTCQVFGPWAQAIPRPIIVLIGTGVYIALSIVGASHFASWLDTLLVLLSYWLAIFATIVAEEHFIFRRGSFDNYDFDAINHPSRLPLGVAAFLGLGAGIAGAVLGMSQQWYVGKIAILCGEAPFGGDIGFELSWAFSGIVYPVARVIEKHYMGR